MAKGRMLDREISDSRKIARLKSDTHRMAYAFILPFVDREGRMEADPVLIAGQVFTRLEHMHAGRVKECLDDLAEVGLVTLYEVDDVPVLQITRFHDHNTPHWNEAPSKFPPPPGEENHVADTNGEGGGKQGPTKKPAGGKQGPTRPGNKVKVNKANVREDTPREVRPEPEASAPPPQEGEILGGLTNENDIGRLKRVAPEVHDLFEQMARLQRSDFAKRLAQAKALLGRIEARGADAVANSLKVILETAGDGGRLFSRALAHLDRQKTPPTEVEHDDTVTGADLLDVGDLGGKWGAN